MTILIHLSRDMAAVSPVTDTDCHLEQLTPSSTVTDSEGGSGMSVCLCEGVVFPLGTERQSQCGGNIHTGVWQEVAGVRECCTC